MEDCSTRLVPVPVEDLNPAFQMIRPGLQKVIDRGEAVGWEELDVYYELRIGASELLIGYEDNEYCGFMVLTPGDDYLFIWITYALPGKRHLFNSSLDQLEADAREAGMRSIKFGTTRQGWLRLGPKLGFQLEELRFSKPL